MAGRRHLEMLASQRRSLLETLAELERPTSPEPVLSAIEDATGIRLAADEAAELAAQLNRDPPRMQDFSALYLDAFGIPPALAARQLANHTQAVWSTGGHTSEPVLLFGFGPGSEGVLGIGLNTRVHGILMTALGGDPSGPR